MPAGRIALNMIVKDEARVIRRCLESVRPYIDRWVIVDTGSTDGTQDVVREHMAGIEGVLHERPWRDFGTNRTEALTLARGVADYLLIIDADETLCAPTDFKWPELTAAGYHLPVDYAGTEYGRCCLVASRFDWRWVGVLHEYIDCKPPVAIDSLPWPRIVVSHDGARARDPETYAKDAAILERALAAEPGNARYAFYLAQSYRDAGRLVDALHAYRRRSAMPGFAEEAWYSLFQIGTIHERLGHPPGEVTRAYLDAWQARPTRAEPLCELARYHRQRKEFALAVLFARQAAAIAEPSDSLFVDVGVYRWRALDELATSAYYAGALDDGRAAAERLLEEGRLPASERPRVEANLRFYLDAAR